MSLAHAVADHRPARAWGTGKQQQPDGKHTNHASREPGSVACCGSMAKGRRRKNHGERAHASAVVSTLLARHVPRDQMRLSRVRDAWEETATATVAARAWPAAVSGDELVIDVHDNQWLHELTYLRQSLLDRIREHCPTAQIGRIRLRIGPVPKRSPRPSESPEPSPQSPLPAEPSADTRSALDAVSDPDLRNLLAGARVALGRPPSREG